MNIGSDEKIHIARLLNFLLSGEKIAYHCAKKQACLCDDDAMKRFFKSQERQEKFHALTFQAAILWLVPKGVRCPARSHIQQYESLLTDTTDNNDLPGSVFGLQAILEGMGDIVLEQLNHGMDQRDIGYQKIRGAIIAQEDRHHTVGLTYLENKFHSKTLSDQHRHLINNYLSIINEIFLSLQGLLHYFDEDAIDYINSFNLSIPNWIHLDALDHHSCA